MRASVSASSVASVPELVKRSNSIAGKRFATIAANSASTRVWPERLRPLSTACLIASAMIGLECPARPAVYSPMKSK